MPAGVKVPVAVRVDVFAGEFVYAGVGVEVSVLSGVPVRVTVAVRVDVFAGEFV